MAGAGTNETRICLRREKHRELEDKACEELMNRDGPNFITLASNDGKVTRRASKAILGARSKWMRDYLSKRDPDWICLDYANGEQLHQLLDLFHRNKCDIPDGEKYKKFLDVCKFYGVDLKGSEEPNL